MVVMVGNNVEHMTAGRALVNGIRGDRFIVTPVRTGILVFPEVEKHRGVLPKRFFDNVLPTLFDTYVITVCGEPALTFSKTLKRGNKPNYFNVMCIR
jgi:hypothetical protein